MWPWLLKCRKTPIKNKSLDEISKGAYEVKEWRNVEIHTCEKLDKLYIVGKQSMGENKQVILPLNDSAELSHLDLQLYSEDIPLAKQAGLTLAIVASDTTTVYYRISSGVIPPDSPKVSELKHHKKIKRSEKRREVFTHGVQDYLKYNEWKKRRTQGDES